MDVKNTKNQYWDEAAGIYLRPITDEDTGKIVDWRNSEEVRRRFIYREPFTEEGHRHWLETMVKPGKAIQMMICDMNTDSPLGSVFVRDVDRKHSKAEYGIFIGEADARGRGIGTAAAKLMLKLCFREEKLHRVFLRVLADNQRAIRSYEKAGFVREAYLRESVFLDGTYRDVILMSVLDWEWRKNHGVEEG